jgi:hypothetical protein
MKKMTPLKAIKAYCLDCCNDNAREVTLCPSSNCPLYNFRKGRNMNVTRTMSDEQKQEAIVRLAKGRANLLGEANE